VSLLADYLIARGYTVSCPLLPGHGTTIEDLHQTSWQDWADHAERAYRALKSDCETIFVGGESVGSCLAIYLAVHYPEISGLILNAPALYTKSRFAPLTHVLKYFMKTRQKNRGSSRSLVGQRWQGYSIDSLPAISEVLKLQRYVRRRLPEIDQPAIIFQGLLDETISPDSAREIHARISSTDKSLVWLENSPHCVLLDYCWETIANQSAEFITRVNGGN
jgi:carboxylesterase